MNVTPHVAQKCPTSRPALPKLAHPRPQAGSLSSWPSQENSAQADPSREP